MAVALLVVGAVGVLVGSWWLWGPGATILAAGLMCLAAGADTARDVQPAATSERGGYPGGAGGPISRPRSAGEPQ